MRGKSNVLTVLHRTVEESADDSRRRKRPPESASAMDHRRQEGFTLAAAGRRLEAPQREKARHRVARRAATPSVLPDPATSTVVSPRMPTPSVVAVPRVSRPSPVVNGLSARASRPRLQSGAAPLTLVSSRAVGEGATANKGLTAPLQQSHV